MPICASIDSGLYKLEVSESDEGCGECTVSGNEEFTCGNCRYFDDEEL